MNRVWRHPNKYTDHLTMIKFFSTKQKLLSNLVKTKKLYFNIKEIMYFYKLLLNFYIYNFTISNSKLSWCNEVFKIFLYIHLEEN